MYFQETGKMKQNLKKSKNGESDRIKSRHVFSMNTPRLNF